MSEYSLWIPVMSVQLRISFNAAMSACEKCERWEEAERTCRHIYANRKKASKSCGDPEVLWLLREVRQKSIEPSAA